MTGSMATGGLVDDQSNVVSEEDELQRAIQVSMTTNDVLLCLTVSQMHYIFSCTKPEMAKLGPADDFLRPL